MKEISVSVIVPVYRVENYLSECIQSIIAQTYTDFELILVDDGSPDLCGSICNNYAKDYDNIKVIHKLNGGLSSARNAGIDIACGKYLAFIDGDDYVHPNYLRTLLMLAEEYGADLVCCNYIMGDTCEWKIPEKSSAIIRNGNEVIDNMFINDAVITVAWNKLYHNKFFTELKLRYPEGKNYEDMFLTPQILYNSCRMVITDIPLYFYRIRTNSIMTSYFSLKKLDLIEAIEFRMEFFRNIQKEKLFYMELEGYIRKLIWFYGIIKKENQDKYTSEIKSLRLKLKIIVKDYLLDRQLSLKSKLKICGFFLGFLQ